MVLVALFLGYVGIASFDVVYQAEVDRYQQSQDK